MGDPNDPNRYSEITQHQFTSPVSTKNQFTLPGCLVDEVGYLDDERIKIDGAMVKWYHDEIDDKAVISNDQSDRPNLTYKGVSSVSGVSKKDLESNNSHSGRVTIVSNLPDHIVNKLTSNSVVLKPIYANQHSDLETTHVSVYPAIDYYDGTLPNVNYDMSAEPEEDKGSSKGTERARVTDIHTNSV